MRYYVTVDTPDVPDEADLAQVIATATGADDATAYASLCELVESEEPTVCLAGNPTRADLPCDDPDCPTCGGDDEPGAEEGGICAECEQGTSHSSQALCDRCEREIQGETAGGD